jgi:hypothetical protein
MLTWFKEKLIIAQVKALSLPNPLGEVNSLQDVVLNIINFILGIVGLIALIELILGGFTILTSGGNPEKVKKGKDTIVWSIIGLAIIFGSYMLLQQVFDILQKSTNTSP